jgi:hypothetical protein
MEVSNNMDLYTDIGALGLTVNDFDNDSVIELDPSNTIIGSFLQEIVNNMESILNGSENNQNMNTINTIDHFIESPSDSTTTSISDDSYLISREEYAKNKFLVFREDVIDYFSTILSIINKNNIKTKINYKKRLDKIIKDFPLRKILRTINYLINDKVIKKNLEVYKNIIIYINSILGLEIMKCTLTLNPGYKYYLYN